jgi:hypothetical protein
VVVVVVAGNTHIREWCNKKYKVILNHEANHGLLTSKFLAM